MCKSTYGQVSLITGKHVVSPQETEVNWLARVSPCPAASGPAATDPAPGWARGRGNEQGASHFL